MRLATGPVLPKRLGGWMQPASQNPYPTYDQNLRFSLSYLWPEQIFDTLFGFIDNDESSFF